MVKEGKENCFQVQRDSQTDHKAGISIQVAAILVNFQLYLVANFEFCYFLTLECILAQYIQGRL